MKTAIQAKAEHDASVMALESTYTEVNGSVSNALRRCMALRQAALTLELKLKIAVSEYNDELAAIESNFK